MSFVLTVINSSFWSCIYSILGGGNPLVMILNLTSWCLSFSHAADRSWLLSLLSHSLELGPYHTLGCSQKCYVLDSFPPADKCSGSFRSYTMWFGFWPDSTFKQNINHQTVTGIWQTLLYLSPGREFSPQNAVSQEERLKTHKDIKQNQHTKHYM